MRPGQIAPNEFELALLDRLASKEPALRRAVEHLRVLSREFTAVGSYTNFACEDAATTGPDKQLGLDALIAMPGVPNGMGAVLFCKGDTPQCLEVFAYGDDHWEGVYEGFTIQDVEQL